MDFYEEIEGELWGIAFLRADSRLSEEERTQLVLGAARMYIKDADSMPIRGDTFEGRMKTNGKHYVMGSFRGRAYDAEIDIETASEGEERRGTAKVGILLNRVLDPTLN